MAVLLTISIINSFRRRGTPSRATACIEVHRCLIVIFAVSLFLQLLLLLANKVKTTTTITIMIKTITVAPATHAVLLQYNSSHTTHHKIIAISHHFPCKNELDASSTFTTLRGSRFCGREPLLLTHYQF